MKLSEEKYNDIMIVVRYREPYDYHLFDEYLNYMNYNTDDYLALSDLDIVDIFQAWLKYQDEKDFKEKPLKYLRLL